MLSRLLRAHLRPYRRELAIVLALFIPLIISSGGNSGSQATSLIIRAMALGEVELSDWWRVARRELASGLVLGGVLGLLGEQADEPLGRSPLLHPR